MKINYKKWNEYIKGFFLAVYGGFISGVIVAGYFYNSFLLSIIYVIIFVMLGGLGGYIFYSRIGRLGESESMSNPALLSSSYQKRITKTDAKKLIGMLALKEDNAIINFGEFLAIAIAAISLLVLILTLLSNIQSGINSASCVLVVLIIVVCIALGLAIISHILTKRKIECEINDLVNRYNSLKEYAEYALLKKANKKCYIKLGLPEKPNKEFN